LIFAQKGINVDDFPPNSHTSKETAPKKQKEETSEKVPIEKVISGNVIRRKKPLGTRIKETFILGDGQSVLQYIMAEVVIPATKDLIADTATSAVERMLFGDQHNYGRRHHRSSRSRPQGDNYTRYTQVSKKRPPWEDDRRPSRETSRRRPANDFQEIILETRAECAEVIDQMFDLTEKYETATVADLYDLIGVDSNYTDDKWGWYDVRDFNIRRISNGYLLDIPRPEPLK
jgi:hypothetical protein